MECSLKYFNSKKISFSRLQTFAPGYSSLTQGCQVFDSNYSKPEDLATGIFDAAQDADFG